jgi:RNase P/RNase MRP subunit POP5
MAQLMKFMTEKMRYIAFAIYPAREFSEASLVSTNKLEFPDSR